MSKEFYMSVETIAAKHASKLSKPDRVKIMIDELWNNQIAFELKNQDEKHDEFFTTVSKSQFFKDLYANGVRAGIIAGSLMILYGSEDENVED
jgi:hypothetical protein